MVRIVCTSSVRFVVKKFKKVVYGEEMLREDGGRSSGLFNATATTSSLLDNLGNHELARCVSSDPSKLVFD